MTKLELIRREMEACNIAAYMVLSDDFHNSEYVGEYFKLREYLSGFTGSAGTLIVTKEKAGLWTDGRYFIQANKQLNGSGIQLYKSGVKGVQTIEEFLDENLSSGESLCVDGRTMNYEQGKKIQDKLEKNGVKMIYDMDLSEKLWKDRPEMSAEKAFSLDIKYAGESREEKLVKLREQIKLNDCNAICISSLDDICWLLNIRGNDVNYNPVVLSYLIVTLDKVILYISSKAVDKQLKADLKDVSIKEYFEIYDDVEELYKVIGDDVKIMFDGKRTNYTIGSRLMSYEGTKNVENPTLLMKAIKNSIEIENIRKAHIMDGVALTKFMCYVKKCQAKINENEFELGKLIAQYRSNNEGYMGESFEPIVAFGANAAMCHYSANEEDCSDIEADSFLLFDTGGQYLCGTTDVTRTIAIGNVSEVMKKHYTAVLKGNLKLGNVKFPKGVRGINLDILAREALWQLGLDYNHGTGHGVGYFLNVHEGPNSIRFRGNDTVVFEEGMVTSNEPGYYEEGKYGIRLENLILCKKSEETEYGQFMEFETLTKVPFDLDCIDVEKLDEQEKTLLNNYHKTVFEQISPYLDEEEKQWLKEATRQIW